MIYLLPNFETLTTTLSSHGCSAIYMLSVLDKSSLVRVRTTKSNALLDRVYTQVYYQVVCRSIPEILETGYLIDSMS